VQFVSHRLSEAERISSPAGTSRAPAARWAEFDRVVTDAGSALVRLRADDPNPGAVTTLAGQRTRWAALLPVVPADQRTSVQQVLQLLTSITGTLPSTADPAAIDPAATDPAAVAAAVGGARPPTVNGADSGGSTPSTATGAPGHATPAPSGTADVPRDGGAAPRQGKANAGSPTASAGGAGTPTPSGPSVGGTTHRRPQLPLVPRRGELPSRSNTSSSSWDGGPAVLERTSDALTRLLPRPGTE
jgi:hypothetical protein